MNCFYQKAYSEDPNPYIIFSTHKWTKGDFGHLRSAE